MSKRGLVNIKYYPKTKEAKVDKDWFDEVDFNIDGESSLLRLTGQMYTYYDIYNVFTFLNPFSPLTKKEFDSLELNLDEFEQKPTIFEKRSWFFFKKEFVDVGSYRLKERLPREIITNNFKMTIIRDEDNE